MWSMMISCFSTFCSDPATASILIRRKWRVNFAFCHQVKKKQLDITRPSLFLACVKKIWDKHNVSLTINVAVRFHVRSAASAWPPLLPGPSSLIHVHAFRLPTGGVKTESRNDVLAIAQLHRSEFNKLFTSNGIQWDISYLEAIKSSNLLRPTNGTIHSSELWIYASIKLNAWKCSI